MSRTTIRSSRIWSATLVTAGALAVALNVAPSATAVADTMHRAGSANVALSSGDRDEDMNKQGTQPTQPTQPSTTMLSACSAIASSGLTGLLGTINSVQCVPSAITTTG
ncbi:hypothetical protein ACF09J_23270 [Streptomyces sp. NPDC014889]|uniref:hypothetical protein n=1 Tax=Streptomyces sp. NPDC014889 TaxID=3364928 RepID=UPI0036F76532